MSDETSFSASHMSPDPPASGRGPVEWVLDLFSGFRMCVVLLSLLFVYCSIGSAGMFVPKGSPFEWEYQQIRQWPIFEMTEFEWFHTWVFYALNGLLVVNMVTATIRRIPFRPLSYGSWMIHSGIIVLVVGCVIYFSMKIEGDTPVWRRQVVVTVPGASATLPAIPGKRTGVTGADGFYDFQITDTNPEWPVPGGDGGETALGVSVRVSTPRGDIFVRQLVDGHEELTEDVIPLEGRARTIERFDGNALVDPSVAIALTYDAQDRYWVKDSSAIHLREGAIGPWSERRVPGMPRYNAYLASLSEAHPESVTSDMVRPLSARAKLAPDDAFPDVSVRVTGYAPYAVLETRFQPSDDMFAPVYPVANLDLSTPNAPQPTRFELVAFDPELAAAQGGSIRFDWVDNPRLVEALDNGHAAILTIAVPGAGVDLEIPFTSAEMGDAEGDFVAIEGTEFSYRVSSLLPRFPIGERKVSLAVVDFRTPEGEFTRWVANDPALTRDMSPNAGGLPPAAGGVPLDERFVTTFDAANLSMITLVAGPTDVLPTPRILVLDPSGDGSFISKDIRPGDDPTLILPGQQISARLSELIVRSERVTLPRIVPESQRDRDITRGRFASLAQIELTVGERTYKQWAPFHHYVFDDPAYYGSSMGRFSPAEFRLNDGRVIQAVFGRETRPLPNPVILSDFHLDERVGGYTETAGAQSVVNWTSELRFLQSDATWTDQRPVSANNPKAFGGLWFFQASWDPPRAPSPDEPAGYAGLNHTGLGVGNREGVWTMLIGSCISVLGMIYAFYVKPVLKRRKRTGAPAGTAHAPIVEETRRVVGGASSRVVLAGWFLAGVLIAGGAAYLALKASLRSAISDPTTFAGQVDLGPLDRSAVYSRARLKSFDSFANEVMGFVSGNRKINGQPTDFTFLDLLFVPELYTDEEIIFVKKKQIRQKLIGAAEPLIADMTLEQGEGFRQQLDAFMETGLVSPTFFELSPVRAQLRLMQRDVVRTAKFVTQIENALVLRRSEVLGDLLKNVPPPSGTESELWLSPVDLAGGPEGRPTSTSILAEELPRDRRDDLRDAFQRLGDVWFQTRMLDVRTSPRPLADMGVESWQAYEKTLLDWLASLPSDAGALVSRGNSLFTGIASLNERERFGRLDAFADELLRADLAWADRASRFFALVHIAELAASEEILPERLRIGSQRASDAVAQYAALLPTNQTLAEGGLYPEKNRLMLESWYFKVGGATWIWIVYLLSVLMLLMAVVYKWPGARAMGMGLFWSAFLMHTVVLGWRWYVSGRWPNSNMFEAVTTSVWLGTLCVIVIEVFARRTPLRNLFALTAAGASMVAMMSADFLPQLDSNINNMMPILHDLWLYIHTNVIIASYALIAMAAVTSMLYLAWRGLGNAPDHATIGGTDMLLRTKPGRSGSKRLTSAGAVFDGATMILIELSFIMLWAGLVMGAIWADHSWGRPWGWDPKEVFALNTFFVYLVLIHIRLSSKDKGLWTALLSLFGCGVMLFNWIVINFVISGLHSYA
ncbi:MAG: cytochrome c biogenesis protein CcsA [Planctomycetota bacterium]